MKKELPAWAYKIAIVVATIIWGYSFVSMKGVVAVLPPAWLLGFRFLFAGIVLTAILWKRVREAFSGKMVLAGTVLGLADFLAFWTQTVGLEHTTPGINAFLTATYCVIVPFLWWIVAHRRPTVFNIGAAGQYCAGVALSLYAALAWGWSWLPCMLLAMVGGALLGAVSGLLKSYCNVNEVISGIMLNWIVLYLTNMLLTNVKEVASPYTVVLADTNPGAILPSLGLGALFNDNKYVGLALPLSVVIAILVWVVLEKTRFGYELRATGNNKNAAKYCGMAEKRNIILTLAISGALAALGASMFYLTGYEQWQCTASSVPGMGFSGIAAAFLGGLHPIGTILASFFIQHITAGGAYVDKTMYCAQISDLIAAVIIYLCGFVLFMKYAMNSAIARREEKAIQKAKAAEQAASQTDASAEKGGDQ